jgi:hypothetical protein
VVNLGITPFQYNPVTKELVVYRDIEVEISFTGGNGHFGEELPNLPPSMKSMFSSPRVATSVPTEISKSTLSYFQIPVPFVFQGAAMIPLKIK